MATVRHAPPTEKESEVARRTRELLARYAREDSGLTLCVSDAEQEASIELPAGAVALLMDILETMAMGKGLTLIPENAELTTVQAADLLNVSRPFLIGLLEAGKIPYRKVGTHRRIRIDDVMEYKENTDRARRRILAELVAEAQEHDMGYDDP